MNVVVLFSIDSFRLEILGWLQMTAIMLNSLLILDILLLDSSSNLS
jgi:hypothetical protein